MARVYIGLGSNLDDPAKHVVEALDAIDKTPQCRLIAVSSSYRSIAVGPGEQPDYVNAAALVETTLSPLALLDVLQAIELQHGRVRDIRWGARTLDLDILLYDNQELDSERLILPHPRAHERDFVLKPLADIDASLCFPNGHGVVDYLREADDNGLQPLQAATELWQRLRG